MGLGYAMGLRRQTSEAVVMSRERDGLVRSVEHFCLRVPLLNRKERNLLAQIGALNQLDGIGHRRDALWQVERAGKLEGPLLRQRSEWLRDDFETLPLNQMNAEERLVADYSGTGLTIGKHPMQYRRAELWQQGIFSPYKFRAPKSGEPLKTAGALITPPRPAPPN